MNMQCEYVETGKPPCRGEALKERCTNEGTSISPTYSTVYCDLHVPMDIEGNVI